MRADPRSPGSQTTVQQLGGVEAGVAGRVMTRRVHIVLLRAIIIEIQNVSEWTTAPEFPTSLDILVSCNILETESERLSEQSLVLEAFSHNCTIPTCVVSQFNSVMNVIFLCIH